MLEDQVANLLQKYLGNYVLGLNKEALKISVWRGDVELTNMQLRPEALNALKLPVKVKAGFLGSVRLKVPWSKLGQEPVLVYLDRILVLAEPATQVEGCSEDSIQEAKKIKIRELEQRLLEHNQQLNPEMNASWLGSLVNTIIGNIKLSITNVHIRYEDIESNPGHPFAAGLTLKRLSAVTVDDSGNETFATGGALERIQKSVKLDRLSFYFDSDVEPWLADEKPWADMHSSDWNKMFEVESLDGKLDGIPSKEHNYVLQPVTGSAKYTKLRLEESKATKQALQQAAVSLDDVTLCLSKEGYRDILKLADNFTAFNQRLKYAHYRPSASVQSDPKSWWKYAFKVLADDTKKASGRLSWEQVLRYAKLRKRYLALYVSLLKSDGSRSTVEVNKEIDKMDRELDIEVIIQWRMLAHKFVKQSVDSDAYLNKQKAKQSWWSFGWAGSSDSGNEGKGFSTEDMERLNKIIGYKEGSDDVLIDTKDGGDLPHLYLEVHMKHNASNLTTGGRSCLAGLSCEGLVCSIKTYSETKVFKFELDSYKLTSRYGLLAESATENDSLVGTFCYKPFDTQVDWSFVAKASPCYMTYLKASVDEIVSFFKSNTNISQTLALETAAAMQMTIDGVKRSAQQQVTRVLKDQSRFILELDIAAPKITIPTDFCPDNSHATRLLLDLGNLMLCTEDYWDSDPSEEKDMYLQFNLVLSDVSAFLVDGDYQWKRALSNRAVTKPHYCNYYPVIDKCGIVLKLQQLQSNDPLYPSTRLALRVPSLGFHFSPARYHRLLQVAKIFQDEDTTSTDMLHPWSQADFEGWLFILTWKGVGNREAVWKRRYVCLVGPFLYILDSPSSKTYKNYISLRGKQVHQVPAEYTGGVSNLLVALYDAGQLNSKVLEDSSALILRFDSEESRKIWKNRLQGAIYRASGSSAITAISDDSSFSESLPDESQGVPEFWNIEKLFVCGILDELKVCFSCSNRSNQSFKKMLLCKENPLFEFRAGGGQVELSIKANNILIGTVLKSLDIEDQFCFSGSATPRYLARSFINDTEKGTSNRSSSHSNQQNQSDNEDNFFEASESLDDLASNSVSRVSSMSEYYTALPSFSVKSSVKPPTFTRIPGLIPDAENQVESLNLKIVDTLDSFVKAQIIIYDQDSPQYNNLDNRVTVTLATLSFFCHRPTILAILEFVNDINITDTNESDGKKTMITETNQSDENNITSAISINKPPEEPNLSVQELTATGLLAKGKSRVIFHLTLNMARAQIFLMNENGTSLATLSQNYLLTDIKVYPSSFSIKAALGNLKISDDSLSSSHSYFWVCDMRNPGGSSFVELDFNSFNEGDEDYCGYEYSLIGKLSEVRIVYLNRFIQEVVSYFMGLVPSNSDTVVKLKDQVTNSEKWVTTSEIEGSPAFKLDLSLNRPIIIMPRRTDSSDYLELDVVHITVQNTFQWIGGDKDELKAVHLEVMTIKVKDISLTVGTGATSGESIIHDVRGVSIVIQRSLRDILHQIPDTEVAIKIEVLKAALSNREYEIITECASSNISETPRTIPALDRGSIVPSDDIVDHSPSVSSSTLNTEIQNKETWITMKTSVSIDLVELRLHAGLSRDSPLATVQASGAWVLFKSNTYGEGFLFATLRGFSVIDAREGTREELRFAIGKSGTIGYDEDDAQDMLSKAEGEVSGELGPQAVPSMLILDAIFRNAMSSVTLSIQRPKLLVALDFLFAIAEFFVPSIGNMLSSGEDSDPLLVGGAVVVDQSIYIQPSFNFSLSVQKPLVVDDERFDKIIYDGKGGKLHLQTSDRPIIYIGSGKRLQFTNVTIVNGELLDSCIFLGTDSSYTAFESDAVFLEKGVENDHLDTHEDGDDVTDTTKVAANGPVELVIELQAIGPELTFYNTSEDIGELSVLSTKVLHAHLDIFCRLVMKGDTLELNGNILGLKVESNGMRVLEPFDTCVKFSNSSGKTDIHLAVSDIFMNFSFSILRLFVAVQEDILAYLRMTSKKVTVVCSQFDKVGMIQNYQRDQTYTFWRPRAPSGYAVLGDCMTPLNEPPSKGVLAVNTNIARVKRPASYRLVWSGCSQSISSNKKEMSTKENNDNAAKYLNCSVWFPIAPEGYVALGCVISEDCIEPPLSSSLCILASLVSPCLMKDCVALSMTENYLSNVAFWRVENSFGSFLPADPLNMNPNGGAYELRYMIYSYIERHKKADKKTTVQKGSQNNDRSVQIERSTLLNSGRIFEAVASFRLVWWNQGTNSRKKLSIWRPVLQQGMVYLGDLAVQGYEPPNSAIVLHDTGDEAFLKYPQDFLLVGQIRKQKGNESISFWLPQAPPGFVAMGCVASKSFPKVENFSQLRCIRSDMVTGDQFAEESIWDSSDTKVSTEPFSLWCVGNELGTFLVRNGFKKPPKRFALKIASPTVLSGPDNTVIRAEIKTFSAAVFDDYGGLMVPLFNLSLDSIIFSMHGKPDYLNSTVGFSLAARSYNDKYDAWEPLIEPTDGFIRYEYELNAPGATTQIRITSTKDLNLNVSVSNANMMFQAYSSWNNLSHIDESHIEKDVSRQNSSERSIIDVHHRKSYYIIPHNKLGQDIYIRSSEIKKFSNIVKMPSGDNKPVKVPVAKNMLDSHIKGKFGKISRSMVTIIIGDAELPTREGLNPDQYLVTVRLFTDNPINSPLQQQKARTRGAMSEYLPSGLSFVKWREAMFFKIDCMDHYLIEFVVVDVGSGVPIGSYSSPLKQIASDFPHDSRFYDSDFKLSWRQLSLAETLDLHTDQKVQGRISCSVLLSLRPENKNDKDYTTSKKSGFLQISPTVHGPWTTVRLNYAASAACWRLGNDVVASEVTVKDGNRYVCIRSLVSVTNKTDFDIDLRLKSITYSENKKTDDNNVFLDDEIDISRFYAEDFFEVEKFTPSIGWTCISNKSESNNLGPPDAAPPDGWEWVDEWHIDTASVRSEDGWVYAPNTQDLKWPQSSDPITTVNYARQRRWIRNRKYTSYEKESQVSIGVLKPGESAPLPLSGLAHPQIAYALQLRPYNITDQNKYSWSSVVKKQSLSDSEDDSEISVSALTERNELLYCLQQSESSSSNSLGLWFCLSIKARQIGKDVHADPIHDWNLIIDSPLSLTNFLPFSTEYTVADKQIGEEENTKNSSEGTLLPGKSVKIYNADLRDPLYLSVLPEGGWELHEPVAISHPSRMPSKMICLKNSFSGRIVQVILEQNYDEERLVSRAVKIHVPYWITIAKCPPIEYKLIDLSAKRKREQFPLLFNSAAKAEKISCHITEDEMVEGCTIASTLNFKYLGISASITRNGKEAFGPVKELFNLGDMDGSVDLYACDADDNCMRLFVTSKPSPYQALPTKVITIRPYLTFSNRLGQDIFVKFSAEDQPKTLRMSDLRVSFEHRSSVQERVQVRLDDTEWCIPFEILKEDTLTIVLRKILGDRRFIRADIRGYDEGSRFSILFRPEPAHGPIRIENRTATTTIKVRQSGLDDNAWIELKPHSTTKFAWDDPYGQKHLDATIISGTESYLQNNIDLEKVTDSMAELSARGLKLYVKELGDIRIVEFTDDRKKMSISFDVKPKTDASSSSSLQNETEINIQPLEIIIELGIVGVSLIDHRPKELLYLYLKKLFVSYSTGYDLGTTSRFKLIIGQMQLDNQLPLTVMPVLLAPEDTADNHPIIKTTITMTNNNRDGTLVYPYVYVRVTDRWLRINVHEPIIWDLVSAYNNLRLDNIPSSSGATQVDPEIRIDLIDVSEVRLKLALETAPTQRPIGALGIWSPVLSAVGNAFKIQLHLRKVMHRSRFMRQSSIVPAIINRIKRDLIHNPLHLIFSVDVLSMTKSTLASLSKGFADLSTDGQFLQLRTKQVWSRRITGVGDGFLQGTEALAQGVAFGVSGVLRKPVESAREHGAIGFAHGIGRAFLGFVVQPLSGALDFVSLTVDGINASCTRCFEILTNKTMTQRIRNPRAFHATGVLKEYSEREAVGQMVLYLAEASRHLGCTDLFKEPSKYAWSDHYEDHFIVSYQRIVLVTNKRVMFLQCLVPEKMDKKPSKILWDVPWEELLALELAKAGHRKPSHLIIHLKNFKKSESFVRLIKCDVEDEDEQEPQAVMICSSIRRMWKAYQYDMKVLTLKVPSSQRFVQFAWDDEGRDSHSRMKPMIKPRVFTSISSQSDKRFIKHCVNFQKIWSSERDYRSRCTLLPKQVVDDGTICSLWRPLCPDGYVSVGDIAHVGVHPPHVAAIYKDSAANFALPIGYDLVWRNCASDYAAPLTIWLPRPPEGFTAIGCVAVASYEEPLIDSAYCVSQEIVEDTQFEELLMWSAPDAYPWACYIYQVQSEALQCIALRLPREDSDWVPRKVSARKVIDHPSI